MIILIVPVFFYGRIVYCAGNFQPLKNRLYENCYKGIRISVAVVGAQGCQNSIDPEYIVMSCTLCSIAQFDNNIFHDQIKITFQILHFF